MKRTSVTNRTAMAIAAALMLLTAGAGAAFAQGMVGATVPPEFPLGAKPAGNYRGKFTILYVWATSQPESVKGIKEVIRLQKAYGQNEKFGGFILLNIDEANAQGGARDLTKGLPFEQIFEGPQGNLSRQLNVPAEKTPIAYIMSPDLQLVWADQLSKLEETLVKVLAVEKAAAPVDADSPEQAVASLAEGMAKINDRGEFTDAIERLAGLKADLLNDPAVFTAAAQLVLRIKAEKENKSGIERALKANPKAKAMIAQISRRAVTLFNAPLGSDAPDRPANPGGAATPSAPASRDDLAGRKLEQAETLQIEGKDLEAFEAFKDLAQRYAGTDAAKAAAQHVSDYEADPKFMEKYNATAGEEKAQGMLKMARSYKAAGRADLAKKTIDELLAAYPNSAAAAEAKAEGLNK